MCVNGNGNGSYPPAPLPEGRGEGEGKGAQAEACGYHGNGHGYGPNHGHGHGYDYGYDYGYGHRHGKGGGGWGSGLAPTVLRQACAGLLVLALAALVVVSGCARGEGGVTVPQSVMDIVVQFAGPVDDSSYYYVAFDRDADWGVDYPVPIATGPFWGNGWGTGSITHFLQYHLGTYEVYQANLSPVLREPGGGISAVAGTPVGGDAGRFILTVGPLSLGPANVAGAGTITGAANVSGQNAGSFSIATDGAGQTVAGGVTFTPAANGGRTPSSAEQAQLNVLNAGGVTLGADSLNAFGLTLTVGASAAGTQTVTVGATTAAVEARFVPIAAGSTRITTGTLTANSSTPTATPPIPGARLTAGELVEGGQAKVDVEVSQSPTLLGPPFAFTTPAGSSSLRATIDLADLGPSLDHLSFNIIATTELIFDPTITDPARHCYDGLGRLGNDAVTIPTTEFRSYTNGSATVSEGANDSTLRGSVSAARRNSVDIVDWTVTIRRLR